MHGSHGDFSPRERITRLTREISRGPQAYRSVDRRTIHFRRIPIVAGARMIVPRVSIFGLAAVAAHLDDLWIEAADDFDQVPLAVHHRFDIFVDTGNFVAAGRQDVNAL